MTVSAAIGRAPNRWSYEREENRMLLEDKTAVIVTEKIAAPRRWFSVTVGVVAFALAAAIWVDPSLAAGLHSTTDMGMGGM